MSIVSANTAAAHGISYVPDGYCDQHEDIGQTVLGVDGDVEWGRYVLRDEDGELPVQRLRRTGLDALPSYPGETRFLSYADAARYDSDDFDPRDELPGYVTSNDYDNAQYETTPDSAFVQTEGGQWTLGKGRIRSFAPKDQDAVNADEEQDGQEIVAHLHRIDSDFWHDPTDETGMTDEMKAERAHDRALWRERQIPAKRMELHRSLTEWFGTASYRDRKVVVGWQQVDGRWMPKDEVAAVEWVQALVAEKGELSGYASAARTMKNRLAARRKRGQVVNGIRTKTHG